LRGDVHDVLSRTTGYLIEALSLVVALFKEGMKHILGVTEEQIQDVVDYVVSALPGYMKRTLSKANGLTIAA